MAISRNHFARTILEDQHKLLAFVVGRCGDPHLAEDVAQDVFALAVERMEQFEDTDHLLAWCRETARRKTLERQKAESRQPRSLDADVLDMLDPHWSSLDVIENSDAIDALRHCLESLSPSARRIIEVRYREGLTGQKLADKLDTKLNTVYSTLSRAHGALSICIRTRLKIEGRRDD